MQFWRSRPGHDGQGRLDRSTGQVVLPLEEYQAAVDELNITQRASQSVLRECLNRRGHKGLAQQVLEASEDAPADPARKKEEIRVTSIEASYQAPLITQDEAALQDVKAETAKHVDAARASLATRQ